MPIQNRALLFALILAIAVTGCARSDEPAAGDSASPPAGDTGLAGMDHSQMSGMDRGAARDADHEFLRMMSAHHRGLIVMMAAATDRAASATAKADAKALHDKQRQERDSMISMISAAYSDTITPMVMPSGKEMNDSLQQKSGAAYDRDMYRHIVMHHQEGIKMIDDFLPRLTRANVRQMAEKMRSDQQREIQEFQRKQQGT